MSGTEKGAIDAIARKRLLSALHYNLPSRILEEVIEDAYKNFCERRDEIEREEKEEEQNRKKRMWASAEGESKWEYPEMRGIAIPKAEKKTKEKYPRCGEEMVEGGGTYQKGYLVCDRCSYAK